MEAAGGKVAVLGNAAGNWRSLTGRGFSGSAAAPKRGQAARRKMATANQVDAAGVRSHFSIVNHFRRYGQIRAVGPRFAYLCES